MLYEKMIEGGERVFLEKEIGSQQNITQQLCR